MCQMETELEFSFFKEKPEPNKLEKQLSFTLNLYHSILQNNKVANGSFEPSLKGLTAFIVSLCVAFIDRLNCQILRLLFAAFCLPRSNIGVFCHDNNVQIAPFITVFDGKIG